MKQDIVRETRKRVFPSTIRIYLLPKVRHLDVLPFPVHSRRQLHILVLFHSSLSIQVRSASLDPWLSRFPFFPVQNVFYFFLWYWVWWFGKEKSSYSRTHHFCDFKLINHLCLTCPLPPPTLDLLLLYCWILLFLYLIGVFVFDHPLAVEIFLSFESYLSPRNCVENRGSSSSFSRWREDFLALRIKSEKFSCFICVSEAFLIFLFAFEENVYFSQKTRKLLRAT